MKLRHKLLGIVLSTMMVLTMVLSFPVPVYAATGLDGFPEPVDPQTWKVPEKMTWDDWKANPVIDWETDTTVKAGANQKGLVILVEFEDKPFVITQEKGSDPLGNPVIDPVERDNLTQFWHDFLNKPSELNNYTSINGFWRENSYGKWDVEIDVRGPYTLGGMEWEYGINSMNGVEAYEKDGKRVDTRKQIIPDSFALALESGEIDLNDYNFAFIIHAGYDESGAWQEAGNMMFASKEDIPDEFGPTPEEIASIKAAEANGFDISWFNEGENWCVTRYVPWTSWLVAKSVWSHMSTYTAEENDKSGLEPGTRFTVSVQGESDGMAVFAHEFGHIKSIGDNYNNPYGLPEGRSYTGGWELMSRGSFAGPGGTHTRWMIPCTEGASSPAQHMARLKIKQEFYDDGQYVRIDQASLSDGSIFTADIAARAIPIGDNFGTKGISSVIIDLENDKTPVVTKDDANFNWQISTWGDMSREGYERYNEPDKGYYQFYSIEVVDRIGYDSFAYDSGVLIGMNREIDNERAPFMWAIDAHPEDINLPDFVNKETGKEEMVSKGDARQLADALFHAGTGKDVVDEYVDQYNNLHFYVLDKKYDDKGILSYRIAVRSTAAESDIARGVEALAGDVAEANPGRVAVQYVDVTNTGKDTDIFRLGAKTDDGWEIQLQHEILEVAAGETVKVPVYAKIPVSGYKANTLTFTAASESDAEKRTVVEVSGWYPVDESETTTVPETLAVQDPANVEYVQTILPASNEQKSVMFKDIDGYKQIEAIEYVAQQGIMTGTGADTFSPDQNISRAMIVTMLHRLEGYPSAGSGNFTDVNTGDWYAEAVAWAAENGIVVGISESTFGPQRSITREQLASILFRYAKYKGYVSAFAEDGMYIEWAVGTGILERMSDSNQYLKGNMPRAEAAYSIFKFIESVVR